MDMPLNNGASGELPVAKLRVIDVQKLRDQDAVEKQNLLEAAQQEGFFHLSFQNLPEARALTTIVSNMYALEHHLFGMSEEEKMQFDVDTLGAMKLNGYKPIGRNVGGVNGKRDGFESWAIPKDGVLNLGSMSFKRPAVLDSQMGLLETFMDFMQDFTSTIHHALSDALGLKDSEKLELFHRSNNPSPCILRLLKYHAQPTIERGAVQTPHTDLGSLTLLFTAQPGLQVLRKDAGVDAWEFVNPLPNCAIVNIGDALAMMTGGKLQSSLHRVGPLPGHSMDTRYSFAYLQRPENHTVLKLPGKKGAEEKISSGEWLERKFGMLRKVSYTHDDQWVLTGRQEVNVISRAP